MMTIGLLFALKGSCFRAFYRWLVPDAPTSDRLLHSAEYAL